jgi:hypothetical protein
VSNPNAFFVPDTDASVHRMTEALIAYWRAENLDLSDLDEAEIEEINRAMRAVLRSFRPVVGMPTQVTRGGPDVPGVQFR